MPKEMLNRISPKILKEYYSRKAPKADAEDTQENKPSVTDDKN